MINKIGIYDSSKKLTFGSKIPVNSPIQHVSIATKGQAMQQVNQLKNVCKEILLRVANDKSLITKTVAALGVIKLTETAITLFASENDGIRLSMPRGAQGELFKMQLLKDNKPQNSIIIDSFGKLVESYGRESIEYLTENKTNLNNVIATIAGIHSSADEHLFQVRMFMRRAGNSSHIVANKLDNIKMPIIEDFLQKPTTETPKPTYKESFMPTSKVIKSLPKKGDPQNFSYRAIIELNKNEAKKKVAKPRKLVSKPSVENTEKVKRTRSTKAEMTKKAAGVVSIETQAKVNQAIDLFEGVKAELKKVAPMTALVVKKAYNMQTGNEQQRHLVFEDIDVLVKSGKNYNSQKALSVSDNITGESIKILDSGKVLENSKDLSKLQTFRYFHYATQEKLNDEAEQKKINRLLDKTISRLEDFSLFIAKKGWRKHDRQIINPEEAIVETFHLERIQKIRDNYNSIKGRLKKLEAVRAANIRRGFGLSTSKSPKIEFQNPNNDGYNYSYRNSRVGDYYILEKSKDSKPVESYVLTQDGKLLRNSKVVLNGGASKVKYLTAEDAEKNRTFEKLKQIIDVLEKKMFEFENYIEQQTVPKRRGRKSVSITTQIEETVLPKNNGFVTIESVKSFLDKTVADIQTSADKLREITGFKSMLDSVAEDLRTKFDNFLNQFRKN